jgi:hypothetical protein
LSLRPLRRQMLYPTELRGATALILKHLRFEGTQF